MSLNVCINEEIDITSTELFDTEFDGNETFGQNTTLSGNEMDTDDTEIGMEDVKPYEMVEVKMEEESLAEPVTDNSLTCGKCNEEFSSREDLQQHSLTSHDNILQCSICSAPFTKLYELNFHMRTHTKSKPFPCHVCGTKFTLISHVEAHMLHAHNLMAPPESYICETCDLTFKTKESLQLHMHSLHQKGANPIECNICGACFTQKGSLNRHSTIHLDENKQYYCSICSLEFRLKGGVRKHLKKVHKIVDTADYIQSKQPIDKKEHTFCELCDEDFSSQKNLQQHLLIFHDIAITCSICQATFTRQSGLDDHLKLHAGIKQHVCDICGQDFAKLSNYKVHLLHIHNLDENSVDILLPTTKKKRSVQKCDKCNVTCKSSYALKHHIKNVHQELHPFKCSFCDSSFSYKSNLTKHLTTHSNEKPYKCPECSKAFKLSSYLTSHMKRIHSLNDDSNIQSASKPKEKPAIKSKSSSDLQNHNTQDAANLTPDGPPKSKLGKLMMNITWPRLLPSQQRRGAAVNSSSTRTKPSRAAQPMPKRQQQVADRTKPPVVPQPTQVAPKPQGVPQQPVVPQSSLVVPQPPVEPQQPLVP